MEDDLNVK